LPGTDPYHFVHFSAPDETLGDGPRQRRFPDSTDAFQTEETRACRVCQKPYGLCEQSLSRWAHQLSVLRQWKMVL